MTIMARLTAPESSVLTEDLARMTARWSISSMNSTQSGSCIGTLDDSCHNECKVVHRDGQTPARVRMNSGESLPQMMGTVHVQHRVCGRPNCRCRQGRRHRAHYLF